MQQPHYKILDGLPSAINAGVALSIILILKDAALKTEELPLRLELVFLIGAACYLGLKMEELCVANVIEKMQARAQGVRPA